LIIPVLLYKPIKGNTNGGNDENRLLEITREDHKKI